MNTDIWNNETVVNVTGFSIYDIKDCLYDLSEFISQNLSPNRLEYFDIESIKSLESYSELPIKVGLNLSPLKH